MTKIQDRSSDRALVLKGIRLQSLMVGKIGSVTTLALFLLVGCGKSQHEAQWRAHAPTHEVDVGVVVKLNDPGNKQQLEEFLGENKNAQIRVVNGAQGLYEVFHMSKSEIQTNLPGAKPLFKNIYRSDLIPKPPVFHTEAVDISKCKRSPQAPSALIDVTKNETKVQTGILEQADGEVTFTSIRSKSNNLVAPRIDVLWLISGPAGSAYESMTVDKPEVSITPDLPGGYSVILVAQDGASLCGAARVEFGLTYNEAFHGAVAPRAFDEAKDASVFFHLDEIKAREAWKNGANGSGVKIAILDTGVDYNHPDLASNIYVNPNEIPGNGIDDDGNSFVDDTNGWDFFMNDAFPVDDNMHGTHVAGLAASAVSGIANHAVIIPVKVMGATGGGDIASILGGILYAADLHADFANMSLGVDSFGMTPEEKTEIQGYFTQAIQYAKSKGMMVVSAAGNGDPYTGAGFDIDKYPSYPASIIDTNTVGVASVDSLGEITPYSNFGAISVLVAAPGGTEEKPVVSTYYQHKLGNYIGLTGTSMATPVVAGALAAVKSAKPGITNEQALSYLMKTSRAVTTLKGKVKSGGEIDVLAAVQAAQTKPNVLDLWGLIN